MIFSETLLHWYAAYGRDLPWRRTRDPYAVWLSEIILQQTRVAQGRAYWERFMERFTHYIYIIDEGREDALDALHEDYKKHLYRRGEKHKYIDGMGIF